jgi:hypothetical protein
MRSRGKNILVHEAAEAITTLNLSSSDVAADVRAAGAGCGWHAFFVTPATHVEGTLSAFVHHYNTHRPNRGLDLRPPGAAGWRRSRRPGRWV